MDYEQKYKEALERMKSWAKGEHPDCFSEAQKAAEFIFPELKESDEEKVRKALIELVKYAKGNCLELLHKPFNVVSMDAMLAWLEKHDANKEYVFRPLADTMIENAVEQALEQGDVVLAFNGFYTPVKGKTSEEILTEYDNWIEKQCEQPTDKVEPKFKVGDWIVQNDNGTVSQITKVINGTDKYGEYRAYEHTNGYFAECFENEYHLWTINDAKDGDVLVTGVDKNPFIFKGLLDSNHPNCPVAYCGIDPEGYFCVSLEKYWWTDDKDDVQPATKEQRDLLFQKMKEAEYEWDDEKKELRKIEDKMLDADKVIEWLKPYGCVVDNIVEQFKKDFGL